MPHNGCREQRQKGDERTPTCPPQPCTKDARAQPLRVGAIVHTSVPAMPNGYSHVRPAVGRGTRQGTNESQSPEDTQRHLSYPGRGGYVCVAHAPGAPGFHVRHGELVVLPLVASGGTVHKHHDDHSDQGRPARGVTPSTGERAWGWGGHTSGQRGQGKLMTYLHAATKTYAHGTSKPPGCSRKEIPPSLTGTPRRLCVLYVENARVFRKRSTLASTPRTGSNRTHEHTPSKKGEAWLYDDMQPCTKPARKELT